TWCRLIANSDGAGARENTSRCGSQISQTGLTPRSPIGFYLHDDVNVTTARYLPLHERWEHLLESSEQLKLPAAVLHCRNSTEQTPLAAQKLCQRRCFLGYL